MCVQQRQCAQVSSVKGNHTGRTATNGRAKSRTASDFANKGCAATFGIHITAAGRNEMNLLALTAWDSKMNTQGSNFLRSGEKDIHTFAESRRRRKRRSQCSQGEHFGSRAVE